MENSAINNGGVYYKWMDYYLKVNSFTTQSLQLTPVNSTKFTGMCFLNRASKQAEKIWDLER